MSLHLLGSLKTNDYMKKRFVKDMRGRKSQIVENAVISFDTDIIDIDDDFRSSPVWTSPQADPLLYTYNVNDNTPPNSITIRKASTLIQGGGGSTYAQRLITPNRIDFDTIIMNGDGEHIDITMKLTSPSTTYTDTFIGGTGIVFNAATNWYHISFVYEARRFTTYNKDISLKYEPRVVSTGYFMQQVDDSFNVSRPKISYTSEGDMIGVGYRIIIQTNTNTLGAWEATGGSLYGEIGIYSIDVPNANVYVPSFGFPVDVSMHPLVNDINKVVKDTNNIIVPYGETFKNMMKLYNMDTLQRTYTGPTVKTIRLKSPKYSLFPDEFSINGDDLSDTLTISGSDITTYSWNPWNAYNWHYANATITNNITTNTTNLLLFSTGREFFQISVNGIVRNSTTENIPITTISNNIASLINVDAIKVLLNEPYNVIRFYRTKDVFVEIIVRVILDTLPTTDMYYYDGIFLKEDSRTSSSVNFVSYRNSAASASYIDCYGNTITQTTVLSDTVLNGPLSETLYTMSGSTMFFGKVQSYWYPDTAQTFVTIDSDGYIRATKDAYGTYILHPTTNRGHILLTVEVRESPQEYIYYVFEGCQIDVSSIIGGASTYVPNIITGVITATSSIKFNVLNYTFEVNVLEKPPSIPYEIKVQGGHTYDIRELVGIDKRINKLFYSASGGAGTVDNYIWPIATSGIITVCGVIIANITSVALTVNTTSIYARLGKTFNIWDHITPHYHNSTILQVDSNTSNEDVNILPDGTTVVNSASIINITVTVLILGVKLTLGIPVYVLNNNVIDYYATKKAEFQIQKSSLPVGDVKLILFGALGEKINITSTYQGSECEIDDTVTDFVIKNINREFLIFTNTDEHHFVPIQDISTNRQILVKDETGKVTISLPKGPEYQITALALTFNGGTFTFDPSTNSDLTIALPDYNDGTSTIQLKIVEGIKKKFYLVQQRTITNVTPLTTLPSYITVSGPDIIVKNDGSLSNSNTLTIKNTIDNKYYEYVFEVLPIVSINQTIYFSNTNKYNDILPTIGYNYPSISNMTALAVAGSVSFNYGEISGTINLVKYQGATQNVTIYEKYKAIGIVEVHAISTDGNGGDPLILPYSNNGITFTVNAGDIDILKNNPDVEVGQWFFINASGEAILYTFENAPPFKHDDVFINDPPSTWKSDVNMTVPGASPLTYTIGQVFTYAGIVPHYTAEVDYFGTLFAFRILKVSARTIEFNIVDKIEATIPEDITHVSTELPDFISYNNSGTFSTKNCHISLNGSKIVFTNSEQGSNHKANSKFIFKTPTQTYINSLTTHPIPVNPSIPVILELYEDVDLGTYIFIPPTSMGGVNMVIPSPPTFVEGNNTINYIYYGYYVGSFILKIVLIPVPTGFDKFKILQEGNNMTFNIIDELFQTRNGYTLTNAVSSGGGLTVNANKNGNITLSGSTPSTYNVSIDINIKPTTLLSLPLRSDHDIEISERVVNPILTVLVYDPDNIPHKILNVTTGTILPTTFSGTTFFVPIMSNSTLQNVIYNGDNLEGTKHNALSWIDFPNFSVQYDKNTVDDYFFHTNKQIYRITVISLPALPPQYVERIDYPNTSKTVDVIKNGLSSQAQHAFGASLADALYQAGVSISYQNYVLSLGVNIIQVNYIENAIPLLLTTLNILLKQVTAPIITGNLSYVIEINKVFDLKSSFVSTNGKLSVITPSQEVFNSTDGITAFYTTVGNYNVSCILTNEDTAVTNTSVDFIVYDPKEAINVTINTYTGIGTYTLVHDAVSYSIDGANFGLVNSLYCSISGLNVTMNATKDKPRHIVIIYMKDLHPTEQKSIVIITFTLITIGTNQQKFYLEKNELITLSVSDTAIDDLTDTPITSGSLQFDPFGYVLSPNGYEFVTDLGVVGYVTNNITSVMLKGGEISGVWNNLEFDVTIGSEITKVFPYVETLGSLSTNVTDIFTEINKRIIIDSNDFVVPGIEVNFSMWQMNNLTPPSSVIINNSIISTIFTAPGKYTFTAIISSKKKSTLSTNISFNVIVVNPTSTSTVEMFFEEFLSSTILIEGIVKTITSGGQGTPGNDISSGSWRSNDIDFQFIVNKTNAIIGSTPPGQTTIIGKSLRIFSDQLTYTLILENGDNILLLASQFTKSKNINLIGFRYSGQLFNNTNRSVISYSIISLDNSVPSTSIGSTVFQPNIQNSLPGGGTILINTNGSYTVESSKSITFLVAYNNGTIKLIVNGNNPKEIQIEQPSHTELLGTNITKVTINDHNISDGKPFQLEGAVFQLRGNALNITEIQSNFEPTIVVFEDDANNEITISDYLFTIGEPNNDVKIFTINTNRTVSFDIGFEPIKITFDTMSFKGNQTNFDIYTNVCSNSSSSASKNSTSSCKIANVSISGKIMNLTSFTRTGLSQPIGLYDISGKNISYIRIDVTEEQNTTNTSLGQIISAPVDTKFLIIGDSVSNLYGNGILNNKVKNEGSLLQILDFVLLEPYRFYATLSDGTLRDYVVDFKNIEVYVSDITKIPKFLVFGKSTSSIVFTESSITVDSIFIRNPNSLRVINVKTPFFGKIKINVT